MCLCGHVIASPISFHNSNVIPSIADSILKAFVAPAYLTWVVRVVTFVASNTHVVYYRLSKDALPEVNFFNHEFVYVWIVCHQPNFVIVNWVWNITKVRGKVWHSYQFDVCERINSIFGNYFIISINDYSQVWRLYFSLTFLVCCDNLIILVIDAYYNPSLNLASTYQIRHGFLYFQFTICVKLSSLFSCHYAAIVGTIQVICRFFYNSAAMCTVGNVWSGCDIGYWTQG